MLLDQAHWRLNVLGKDEIEVLHKVVECETQARLEKLYQESYKDEVPELEEAPQ